MPTRRLEIEGRSWEVYPSGYVTQSTADEFGRTDNIAMCESPSHLTIAANCPRLNFALHNHMPEAWRCDELNNGRAGLMAPSQCAGASAECVHREAVANNKELRVIPVNRARLVVNGGGESDRPSSARSFDTELHTTESIGVTFSASTERAVINEGCTNFGEGEDRGRLAAAPPGGAHA